MLSSRNEARSLFEGLPIRAIPQFSVGNSVHSGTLPFFLGGEV
jgi:hypothetical protein